MKSCWNDVGLTEKSAEIAENLVEDMLHILENNLDHEAAVMAALKEAIFRRIELPKRTTEFREKYLRANGTPCLCSRSHHETCVYANGKPLPSGRYCQGVRG